MQHNAQWNKRQLDKRQWDKDIHGLEWPVHNALLFIMGGMVLNIIAGWYEQFKEHVLIELLEVIE